MRYQLNKEYYLREVTIDDASDLFEICKKEEVTKFLSFNPHKDLDETKFVINNFYLTKSKDNLPNNYVIVDELKDKVIGTIDFMPSRKGNNIEIGYFLDNTYWGKNIMTLALDKLLYIAFNELNLDEITIYHEEDNHGSKHVILKNNFKYLESVEFTYTLKNKTVLLKAYKITKGEYNDKQS